MSTQEEHQGIGRVMDFLEEWDHGDKTTRNRMLNTFVAQNEGKTYYELETAFALGASLFLARMTTWIRLTYMFGKTNVGLQLKAVGVFLSASSNHQYILEFLEDGGVLTILDILGQIHITAEDKHQGLLLLQTISTTSPKYKEIICESQGVKVVAECLAESDWDDTQEAAQVLLETLVHGNPRYQPQVYQRLVGLMASSSPPALQRIIRTLRAVQAEVKTVHPSILEPVLQLLRSLSYEVEGEALGLILDLSRSWLGPELLRGLVALLRPSEGGQQRPRTEDPEEMTAYLSVLVQQAAAAKAIRLLAQSGEDTSQELLDLDVVHYLLCAMATREHKDSQIQASLALMHFVQTYPDISDNVRGGMGIELFENFMQSPDRVLPNIDEIQAEKLLSNKVHQTKESEVGEC
ncbi:armadillo-like helical domain containing protein 1 [Gadus macrocephalus]|uniref:armadillo-like helical domain containing protein 1 n=1 Tax=Gadus macrocephalus TaxID=80720 RepID=UPI0028CBB639|nr:armadillo-like helical domain containing protein 1 [Gadus macrocephalus]